MMPWGKIKPSITYEGLNDRKQWCRQTTHPGKLTENADQAISRDLLANAIALAHKEGMDLRIHVHDQIVALAPEEKADDALELLIGCLERKPSWAGDLPLKCAGFTSRVFMKD